MRAAARAPAKLTLLGAAAAALLLAPAPAPASGFGVNENSARVMGMGGAFAGLADSPAAIFYNPAGLTQLRGLNLELGLTYLSAASDYTGEVPGGGGAVATVDAERGHLFMPNLHASLSISDRVVAGLGVYVPYGLSLAWPDRVDVGGARVPWWGRGVVRKISLQTLYFNPTVAVRLHRRVSLGLGFAAALAAAKLERAVTLSVDPKDDIDLTLAGDDVGFGATAGLLIQAVPRLLNLGLAYRSGINFTFQGQGVFSRGGDGARVPASLRSSLVDGPATASLALPHVVTLAVGLFPMPGLSVGFSLDLITWSSHDELAITFANTPSLNQRAARQWNNSFAVRLGGEYQLLEDNLPVRLGLVFDQGPVPAATLGPELPDGDRYQFSVGAGYRLSGLSLDLAYQYLLTGKVLADGSTALPGTYRTDAHLVGLSVGYALDI